jgi:anthranilate synthase/aminodeoxychorismate synthase-like glutamine amidotransferase
MKVLVIDNYDSFTYNIVQYIGEVTDNIKVVKNDEITISQIRALKPSNIVVSPGPSWPKNAGISKQAILSFMQDVPILGVCLGHQCMIEALGGKIKVNYRIMHGKVSPVFHDGKGVYKGIKSPFIATRYHSLVGEKSPCQKSLLFPRGQRKAR